MTASISTTSYPTTTSTTRRTAKTTATAIPTTIPGITASRVRPTTRTSWSCASGKSEICWPPCCSRTARRCCWRATSSAIRKTATTMPMRRTTTSTGRTGSAYPPRGRALREFTRRLIATRKAFPILYRSRFLVGSRNEELDVTDVTWLTPAATEMTTEQWQDGNARCFGMLLDGRAQESGIKRRGSDATLLIVFNAHHDVVPFTLPEVAEGRHWVGLIDTAQPEAPPATSSLRSRLRCHRPIALRLRAGGRGHRRSAAGRRVDSRCDGASAGVAPTKPRRPCCPNSAARAPTWRRAAA